MKKILWLLILWACGSQIQAQNVNGQLIASQYGQWTVQGYSPNSYQFAPTSCRVQGGSSFFFAFAQGTPIKIVDGNPSLNEIVTPTNTVNTNVTCSVSIAPVNNHQLPFSLTSATGGLQEALNANVASPQKNTIILDAAWYQLVGASNALAVIAAAQGSTQLGLVDQTQVPYVWYQWSGSQYVAVSLGGGCTGNQCVISLNNIQGTVNLQQGANVTLTPSGQNIIISAQTGAGTPGGPWNSARYGSATGTALPSPSPSLFQIDNTTSLGQLNSLISSLQGNAASTGFPQVGLGTVTIPDGVSLPGYTNATSVSGNGNAGVGINDIRSGVHTTPLSTWGVPAGVGSAGCAREIGVKLTSGSTTAVPNLSAFSSADVGSTLVLTGTLSGIPTRFMPTISSYNAGTGAVTISTPDPFPGSSVVFGGWVGYLATSVMQGAMEGLGIGNLTGQIPSGCAILTDTIAWDKGQSLFGDSPANAQIIGIPARDIFQNPDSPAAGSVTRQGLVFGHVKLIVNNDIDATKPWQAIDASGVTTAQTPLNRPFADHTQPSNDPLGPGWAQGPGPYNSGAQNYVAKITSGSPIICVPTSELGRLTTGHQEVFRDTPTIFKSTVSSLTGAGCPSGSSGVTLTSNAPATIAQAEGVDTTSIQSLSVAMAAGAITYPKTITVANPTTPVPGFESNVAGHGHLKIGNEEYDYQGGNNAIASSGPYTFILQAGPATTAGWAIGTPVVPMNPCYASYETPYPVVPTVNSGNSTPAGAEFFPAWCMGNAAISMPQANGNTYAGTGLADSYLQDVLVNVTDGSYLNQHSTGCYYVGGNNASYETSYDGLQCIGQQYGIIQGPASTGQHGVAAVGPTGQRNHYRDVVLRNAVNMVFDQMEVSSIEGVSAYTTGYNPVDGTPIGNMTFEIMGNTYDEQTGNVVSNTAFINLQGHNAEPENGSHIEIPVYSETDCFTCTITSTNFEGSLNYFNGTSNQMVNSQLSGSALLPVIDFGSHNVVEDTSNTSIGPVSNVFGVGSYLEWGNYGRNGAYSAGGAGPKAAGAVGTSEGYDGCDSAYAITGNFAKPYCNEKSGKILSEEWASAGMGQKILDPTELSQGSYTSCAISPTAACNAVDFNGFSGFLLIGPADRFQPEPYAFYADMKLASGSGSTNVYIRAASNTYATCASPGTVAQYQPNLTSTWQTFRFDADLSSYSGCTLTFSFGAGSATGNMQLGATQFLPKSLVSHLPIATYTAGAACPTWAGPGDLLGIDSTSQYFCGASNTIVAQSLSGGGGVTGLTGDVTGSGTGSIPTTVSSVGGGTPFASQVAGPECNSGGSGQLVPCNNGTFPGVVSGTGIVGGTVINGVYTVPSSATSVFNISIANSQTLTLAQNTTTTLAAGSAGGEIVTFTVQENATGGFSFAWPSNFFFFPAIDTRPSATTTVVGYWDGTNVWASGGLPNVFTTLGDTVYAGTGGIAARLAGNTSTQPSFLSQIGTGSASAAPAWQSSSGTGNVCLTTNCILVTPTLGDASANSFTITGSGNATINMNTAVITAATGVPTGCGTTYGNGSLYINLTGSHAATDLLYVCDAATTTWIDIQ